METTPHKPRLRHRILLGGIFLLVVWLAFFDSHSLFKRYRWHRERTALAAENQRLEREIDALSNELSEGLSDDVVEQIAREQYGMRRPGETVYRVEEND